MKLHSSSYQWVAMKCVVVIETPFLYNALMSSTLPSQVIALMITALVLLSKRFVGITKGVVAGELLISVVGRLLVRVLRLFAKKRVVHPSRHLTI